MKDLVVSEDIKSKIYTIRGMQVMLDSDLANLYQVDTKRINESVKRNPKRFPSEFYFELTLEEFNKEVLKSQNATSKGRGGRRSIPKAFTEQGVAMLSAVLSSDVAVETSINIMNAFVSMRHFISDNSITLQRLRDIDLKLLEHDKNFNEIFKRLENPKEAKAVLFFKGQLWDATSLIEDLIAKAGKSIILIDNYVDKKTLDLLSKRKSGVTISIFTSAKGNKLTQKEVSDFNSQYGALDVQTTEEFHDRFMILDEKILYHIGASIKDAGKKAFEISLIEDKKQTKAILERLK